MGQRNLGQEMGQQNLGQETDQRNLGQEMGQRNLGQEMGRRNLGQDMGRGVVTSLGVSLTWENWRHGPWSTRGSNPWTLCSLL